MSSITYLSASTVTYSMNTQNTLPMTSSGSHRPTGKEQKFAAWKKPHFQSFFQRLYIDNLWYIVLIELENNKWQINDLQLFSILRRSNARSIAKYIRYHDFLQLTSTSLSRSLCRKQWKQASLHLALNTCTGFGYILKFLLMTILQIIFVPFL